MYLKYLKYILKHKYYVFIHCCKLGIPGRGILHDWHKLLPSEFIPYAKYFYGKPEQQNDLLFDIAWLKHQHRGKHHWQHWVLKEDSGTLKALPMPDVYKKEMFADWIGASLAINGQNNVKEWYYNNRKHMILHSSTKFWIEHQLIFVD